MARHFWLQWIVCNRTNFIIEIFTMRQIPRGFVPKCLYFLRNCASVSIAFNKDNCLTIFARHHHSKTRVTCVTQTSTSHRTEPCLVNFVVEHSLGSLVFSQENNMSRSQESPLFVAVNKTHHSPEESWYQDRYIHYDVRYPRIPYSQHFLRATELSDLWRPESVHLRNTEKKNRNEKMLKQHGFSISK